MECTKKTVSETIFSHPSNTGVQIWIKCIVWSTLDHHSFQDPNGEQPGNLIHNHIGQYVLSNPNKQTYCDVMCAYHKPKTKNMLNILC